MNETQINKLIILYIFDQMEFPMQEKILTDLLTVNNWMPYMDAKECLSELIKNDLLVNVAPKATEPRYSITISGREGLTHFYTNIPITLREEIAAHIKKNKFSYRKKQEYISDYYRNQDGTYTVVLKIESPSCTLMDLKIVVQNKNKAKWIHKYWGDKASIIYEHIHETLIE